MTVLRAYVPARTAVQFIAALRRAETVCSSGQRITSALGHKQTFAAQNAMSALPPKADICGATIDVCFTSDSEHENGHLPMVMSALPPKADMCGALAHVGFVPIADIKCLSGLTDGRPYSASIA